MYYCTYTTYYNFVYITIRPVLTSTLYCSAYLTTLCDLCPINLTTSFVPRVYSERLLGLLFSHVGPGIMATLGVSLTMSL